MSMKRILHALNYLPWPPVSGGRRVSLLTLRELASVAPLDLLCFDAGVSQEHIAALKAECPGLEQVITVPYRRSPRWTLPLMNLAGRSYFLHRDRSPEYEETLRELLHSGAYDLFFTDTLRVAPNVRPVMVRRPPGIRWVAQLYNVNSVLFDRWLRRRPWLRPALFLESKLLNREERAWWRLPDRVVFISPADRALAEHMSGPSDRFQDAFPGSLVVPPPGAPAWNGGDGRTVLHVGTGNWAPNMDGVRWFVTRILPLVQEKVPSVRFVHAGRDTGPVLKRLRSGDRVRIHGFVEDLEPLYRDASVFVTPLRFGSGIKIKVLDALARGIPVVTTAIGLEGIPVAPGDGVLVGDTPEEIARHIITLLGDADLRNDMGTRASRAARRLAATDRLAVLLGDAGN